MIPADIKADVKQEIKEGSYILELLIEVPSQNLRYNVKQACIFKYWLAFHPAWYCPLITGGEVVFYLIVKLC